MANARKMKPRAIVAWMVVAICAVAGLAYWDEERESRAALADFAREQSLLARSVAASLAERIGHDDARTETPAHLVPAIGEIERPGLLRVLLARPDTVGLVASDGSIVRSAALEEAVAGNRDVVRLERPEAAELGLPARMALAGVRTIASPSGAHFTVAVVATAQDERDREQRARYRLLLSVILASGLVLAFGGYAMRRQRMELELEHRLEVSEIVNQRDERLVRADKLATMGALATGVAHEVSTPLGVILGRAEQLLPKQNDDRSRRAVETIVAQTERIFAVIRGFLSLARGSTPTLSKHDPRALAQNAVDLVEHRFTKAGVRLDADIPDGLPRIACDPRLFEQVLVNLLLNASDACEQGGVVSLAVESKGDRVAFVITDDGEGISPESAARATEPFFTTKPAGEGTGLGLAIANEIVKHHFGSLTLAPRGDADGTRASVELPAARDEA
jgi:signal transduction histidine kinase